MGSDNLSSAKSLLKKEQEQDCSVFNYFFNPLGDKRTISYYKVIISRSIHDLSRLRPLYGRRNLHSPNCRYCQIEDTLQHTLLILSFTSCVAKTINIIQLKFTSNTEEKEKENYKSISRGLRITFSTLKAPKEEEQDYLHFKGTFCREQVVLHTTPSMFDKFSVHAQRQSLNKENSLLGHRGSNSFWHAKRC